MEVVNEFAGYRLKYVSDIYVALEGIYDYIIYDYINDEISK